MNKMTDASNQYLQVGVEIGQGKYHEEMIYGLAMMYTTIYREISFYLRKYDLTPDEMNVLMLVKHQGQHTGLSQKDLGARLLVNAHNMTRQIQRLEKDGHIKRSSDTHDGRINLVKISTKGSKLLDEIWPGYDERLREVAGKISQPDQASLAGLIQKWLKKA